MLQETMTLSLASRRPLNVRVLSSNIIRKATLYGLRIVSICSLTDLEFRGYKCLTQGTKGRSL
jgi:hypothetical protein